MGTVRKPWTKEEEKILLDCIKDNVNHLQNAFKIAQTKLAQKGYQRTFYSVQARWYDHLAKSGKACFATVSRGSTTINKKNTKQSVKIVGLWPKLKRLLKLQKNSMISRSPQKNLMLIWMKCCENPMTTERQKNAVHFCEECLQVEFEGDINNTKEVNIFLNLYLDDAKDVYNDLRCEFEAYIIELYD